MEYIYSTVNCTLRRLFCMYFRFNNLSIQSPWNMSIFYETYSSRGVETILKIDGPDKEGSFQ